MRTIDEIIKSVIKDAKEGKNIFSNSKDAFYELVKKSKDHDSSIEENLPYSLFEVPLTNGSEDDALNGNPSSDGNCGDITIGFLADTDVSFDIVIYGNAGRLPVFIKKGEFYLAWRNVNIFPGFSSRFSSVWIENLNGSCRKICGFLDSPYRREITRNKNAFKLDNEGWFISMGMVLNIFLKYSNLRKENQNVFGIKFSEMLNNNLVLDTVSCI
jgi:hypothetical protein